MSYAVDKPTSASASVTFDEATMSRSRFWHWFKTPWLFWSFPLFGIVIIALSLLILNQPDHPIVTPWVMLVCGTWFILRYWMIGFGFRRDIRKNPHYGKDMKWTFTEEGYEVLLQGSETKSDWNGFHECFITPDGFLLYPQKRIYYWIPKSGFSCPEEIGFVEAILRKRTNSKVIG